MNTSANPKSSQLSPWFHIVAVLTILVFGLVFLALAMGRMRHEWHSEPPPGQPITNPAPLPPAMEP